MRLDYDRIAGKYDERERDHVADLELAAYIDTRPSRGSLTVLDVGCGTGKQLAANHQRWPWTRLIGVDRSGAMLRIARERCPAACWVHGDAAALPLAAATIDYATSQYSYQHIGHTPALVAELIRVLTPGGRLVITNIDPWSMRGWLVYRYFPDAWVLDARDFRPVADLVALLENAGFADMRSLSEDCSQLVNLEDFRQYVSERHRASQLMAIADAAYEAGLRRLEHDIDAARPSMARARSEFVKLTVIGSKPIGAGQS